MMSMPDRNWNPEQLSAITAFGGNLLVSAAAGSGKTAVLVERVIRMLTRENDPIDADRILAVTFTNLAAAEMKTRINAALTELMEQHPEDEGLRRQQLLMERAHITTISSFCFDVVKENFSIIGISPDVRPMSEQEQSEISSEALAEALENAYSEGDPVFYELSETLGGGRNDSGLEEAVLKLYEFIRSLPYYNDWLSEKADMYDPEISVKETVWGKIILERAASVLKHCIARAEYMTASCPDMGCEPYSAMFAEDSLLLRELLRLCEHESWNRFRSALFNTSFSRMPSVKNFDGVLKDKIKAARDGYKDDIKKLAKLFDASEEDFREDIDDLYPKVKRLFALTMDYDRIYSEKKRSRKLIDFSDMEQFTLSVLTERDGNGNFIPTSAAKDLAARFDYILVDECQDINKAQDTIFSMVSNGSNLFFVGDVKQSIYRFRQAMPELFLEKRKAWPLFDGTHFPATIILGRNYRSRKSIASAVNFVFGQIMSTEAAEMEYGSEEMLVAQASFPEDGIIRNEALLIDCGEDSAVKAEAAVVAKKILDMVQSKMPISDRGKTRPVEYFDICILMRSPKDRSDVFIEALRHLGISCRSDRGEGFLSRPEIAAVLDVLKAADNPLLDIPVAGAMLSEMFGFTPDELAKIRVKSRGMPLYSAVKQAADSGDEKAKGFVSLLSDLRHTAAAESADSVIERLYRLTSYPQIMRALEDGELRLGNLRLLVKQASALEEAGCHGLSAFLRTVERMEENHTDIKTAGYSGFGENCVRLMTVHGSKGLEFPVVFLCGTGKQLNIDTKGVLLHSGLGFACSRRSRETGVKFSTVPCEALKTELRRLNLAEEMRILYVAMTRAKENLIITCAHKNPEKYLASLAEGVRGSGRRIDPFYISGASRESDWIFSALLRHPDAVDLRAMAGLSESEILRDDARWNIAVIKPESENAEASEKPEEEFLRAEADPKITEALSENIRWVYPFAAAEKIPVKAGVSELTHGEMHKKLLFSAVPQSGALSGAARGTALHTFMQFCDFKRAEESPENELKRLTELRFLTQKQAETVNTERVRAFFASGLYAKIRNSPMVKRELRFLQSLPAAELGYNNASADDKITVQGVADCVFEDNGKLYILDYKTDYVENIEELRERYAAQLLMYKRLLSVSLGREVAGAVIWSFRFGEEIPV